METSIHEIIGSYNPDLPLEKAWTIPAPWYIDPRVLELERRTVFSRSWQMVGRTDQLSEPGQYITIEVSGEPIVVVRGSDGVLRGFFNVCRHHAAAVLVEPEGRAANLRCPYHGWTYSLEGELKGTPDFAGVCDFDRSRSGLAPVDTCSWEGWVFVRLASGGPTIEECLRPSLVDQMSRAGLQKLRWMDRRHYSLNCNWKVFVDNYLDGGYHVPHLHRGLDS